MARDIFRPYDVKWGRCNRPSPCILTFDEVYVILAMRKDISEVPNELVRTFYEEAAQSIMNYCNINFVPCELKFTVVSILIDVMDYYINLLKRDSDNPEDLEIDASAVSEVKIGDTQIKLGAATSTGTDTVTSAGRALNSHIPSLDSFVMNYTLQLNPFRSAIPICHRLT